VVASKTPKEGESGKILGKIKAGGIEYKCISDEHKRTRGKSEDGTSKKERKVKTRDG